MAKLEIKQLIDLTEHQFQLQYHMKSLWQVLAEHFYPERSDFIHARNIGSEFADHLVDSFPLLVRRDLGNSLSAMLRDGRWFAMTSEPESDWSGNIWLEEKTERLFKLFNHRSANFTRATKEGDHDYVTFGQGVLSVESNRRHGGLLFRAWHLRDCAWWEDETGQVCGVARRAKPTKRDLVNYFGEDKLHTNVKKDLMKRPFSDHNIMHIVMPAEMYGDDELQSRYPYVSLYVDVDNKHMIEETGLNHKFYVVPRFQTIAGSAYAYSPATTIGISDARCLQAMTHTLLEAAERYARPPIVATANVVRSDIDLSSDGITWVDEEYDQKTGAALQPLYQDRRGWPIGDAERERVVETLNSAFFLNKLNLPDPESDMTAYEVSERMKQFRRQNLPLFAPIEADYNGQLCELAFEVAMQNGLLGSPYDIPTALRGAEVQFKFESPLSAGEREERAQHFAQVRQMLGEAIQLDPSIGADVDLPTALRDAITGMGAPSRWLRNPEQASQLREMQAIAQAMGEGQADVRQ